MTTEELVAFVQPASVMDLIAASVVAGVAVGLLIVFLTAIYGMLGNR